MKKLSCSAKYFYIDTLRDVLRIFNKVKQNQVIFRLKYTKKMFMLENFKVMKCHSGQNE